MFKATDLKTGKKLTKEDKVLEYLKKFHNITPLEALNECGTMRLSAVIYNLKKRGYKFKTEMVRVKTRDGFSYVAQYTLEG